jgi:hypothetical protein
LGEIEVALELHPGIRQAIVSDGADGVLNLAAYVRADEAQPPSGRELRHFLEAKLPAQMVPSALYS